MLFVSLLTFFCTQTSSFVASWSNNCVFSAFPAAQVHGNILSMGIDFPQPSVVPHGTFGRSASIAIAKQCMPIWITDNVVSVKSVFALVSARRVLKEDTAFTICSTNEFSVFFCTKPLPNIHQVHVCVSSNLNTERAWLDMEEWHKSTFPNSLLIRWNQTDTANDSRYCDNDDDCGSGHFD